MEKSVAVEKTGQAFVNWQEVFSIKNRGRKEVRYYLKRRDGTSHLAVVGKEKNLGLTTKTDSSCRYRYEILDKSLLASSNLPLEISSKPRSRREVIDWLSSLVADGSIFRSPQSEVAFLGAAQTLRLKFGNVKDIHLHKTHHHTTEFQWVGSSWTCRKKRKHYEGYTRSGVRISVHNFVYVLAEDGKRLVAYLNDLYEDSRGYKMALVQWFHKVDEIGIALPQSYNDKEIFFSLCLQDLSVECIDGLATVLCPEHFENFLKADLQTKLDPFMCQHQFDDSVKPFDITQVKGYWKQNIHGFMSLTSSNTTQLVTNHTDAVEIRPRKRLRRLVDTKMYAIPPNKRHANESSDLSAPHVDESNPKKRNLAESVVPGYVSMQKHQYTVGSEIEVLSQDSGIRGFWFKAVVIKKHKDKLKVRYQDIKDAVNESTNLEEWVLSSRVAAPDQLGIRLSGRMTIRPSRSSNRDVPLVDVGCVVDAWLHDGWWEGIVVHKESDDRIHVYFPGEKQKSILGSKDLRYSEEWLGNQWKQMKSRRDVLNLISPATETDKSHNSIFRHRDRWVETSRDCDHLDWNWSMKKKRSERLQQDASNKTLIDLKRRTYDGFARHEKCKFICDTPLFCHTVASPLTTIVMSR